MRTIEEYMKLPYKMEIVPDIEEGGYVVSFPDLPGCLTIGDTVEEAIKNAEDAKYAYSKRMPTNCLLMIKIRTKIF